MRISEIKRKTKETDIKLKLNLDGSGKQNIDTGVGFFDHMLTAFSVHSGFDLDISCKGDLQVDCHHTIEDIGIALGSAFAEVLKDKSKIVRYGNFTVPMDESIAMCSVDISGRAYLVFNADFSEYQMGDMDTQMVEEFFRAFVENSNMTVHINLLYGANDHHKCEAIFKAFAHCLKIASRLNEEGTVLSSKGILA